MAKHSSRLTDKFYSLSEKVLTSLQVPPMDSPVAALSSAAVILSEGEGSPKDVCDKCIEDSRRCGFQVSAQAFRTSMANSVGVRAAFLWAEELVVSEPGLSSKAKSCGT